VGGGILPGMATQTYLEVGTKRVFAAALDWPGWCRSGKGEQAALDALVAYVPRYAVVADRAGVPFPAEVAADLDVVERVPGTGTTDFGAPGVVPAVDRRPSTREEAERAALLVDAAWRVFDDVVASAPAELRKGPRGGGRDRDKIVAHVLGAEASYARMLGVRHREPAADDRPAVEALRRDVLAVLRTATGADPLVNRGWPPRYAARRIAWHVLDHAWEIEDRSG
jgi:hypothetical protein